MNLGGKVNQKKVTKKLTSHILFFPQSFTILDNVPSGTNYLLESSPLFLGGGMKCNNWGR